MVNVLGLDIGGANTKAVFISSSNGDVMEFRTAIKYFPFWKRSSQQFSGMLSKLRTEIATEVDLDCVGVTMTAELSDAYRTKREGVNSILNSVANVFNNTRVLVVTVDATLETVEDAKAEPLKVAAANWAATGWMVSRLLPDCVVVDVGSTSTSIIPIADGKLLASGKTDLEKLINGELVYTGALRTNVAATVNSIPLKIGNSRISSELFAQSGDVHLILANVCAKEYTTETADGKGKTKAQALSRLARVVCADTETLTTKEITQIAELVWKKQIEQIADGLSQVYSRLRPNAKKTIPVITAGLGKDFLAKKAAKKADITKTIDITELMPNTTAMASPALGAAMMAATKLEGRKLKWKL